MLYLYLLPAILSLLSIVMLWFALRRAHHDRQPFRYRLG
jgi:hypothetical protein